jgi:hypothetical protein
LGGQRYLSGRRRNASGFRINHGKEQKIMRGEEDWRAASLSKASKQKMQVASVRYFGHPVGDSAGSNDWVILAKKRETEPNNESGGDALTSIRLSTPPDYPRHQEEISTSMLVLLSLFTMQGENFHPASRWKWDALSRLSGIW